MLRLARPHVDRAPAEIGAISLRQPLWERLTWQHPEWWSVVLSAVAWILLIARGSLASPTPDGMHHHGHTMAAMAWPAEAATWMLMVVAMMVPLVLGNIRATAARSLWRRRDRAVASFIIGYITPWLGLGLALVPLATLRAPDSWLHGSRGAAFGLAVAAAWQLVPAKRRALWSCHRTAPLAPWGWRADRDCWRYGWMIGRRCVVSCWALMLACVLGGHSMTVMASASGVAAVERYLARPQERLLCGLLLGLALVYLALPGLA